MIAAAQFDPVRNTYLVRYSTKDQWQMAKVARENGLVLLQISNRYNIGSVVPAWNAHRLRLCERNITCYYEIT